jgi:hypothetical protein
MLQDFGKPGIGSLNLTSTDTTASLQALYHKPDEEGDHFRAQVALPEDLVQDFGAPARYKLECFPAFSFHDHYRYHKADEEGDHFRAQLALPEDLVQERNGAPAR